MYLSGGFLFGAVAGYALKNVMKIAAIVIGLFVIGLISFIQRMDRCKMDRNRECNKKYIDKIAGQAIHASNNTTSQFAAHSITVRSVGLL